MVTVRRSRIAQRIPRTPYTLAMTISYLYASRMVEDLGGQSTMHEKERNERVKRIMGGNTFEVGWTGKMRLGLIRKNWMLVSKGKGRCGFENDQCGCAQ
jgi:hypothetical protein